MGNLVGKMKVRPLLLHSRLEVMTIIKAMQQYRDTLTRENRDIFDLSFSKIVRFGQNAQLNIEDMKDIVVSLKYVAFNFSNSQRKELINLAHGIHFTSVTLETLFIEKKKLTA